MTLPQDPMVLLSYLNTKLRDEYASLTALCDDLDAEEAAITETLNRIGFAYLPDINQFR